MTYLVRSDDTTCRRSCILACPYQEQKIPGAERSVADCLLLLWYIKRAKNTEKARAASPQNFRRGPSPRPGRKLEAQPRARARARRRPNGDF